MGAHSPATLGVARDRTEAVHKMLADMAAADGMDLASHTWSETLGFILKNGETRGTLKEWMKRHDGEPVDTLQVTIRVARDGQGVIEPGKPWAPGSRRVDAARAACVLLDGSRRDYAGVTTFLTDETTYVGFAGWGDDSVQLIVFSA